MFSRIVPLCVVFLLFAALTPAQDAKKELEALQGDWTMAAAEISGEKKEDLLKPQWKLTIKGEQWLLKSNVPTNPPTVTLKIDPSKNPKTIDFTYKFLDGNEDISQGIYKLEGDVLTICRPQRKAERPTEFKSDGGAILVVWKREKK